jgi:hypothetical protein
MDRESSVVKRVRSNPESRSNRLVSQGLFVVVVFSTPMDLDVLGNEQTIVSLD